MSLTKDELKKVADVSVPLEVLIKELVLPHIRSFKVTSATVLRLDGSKTEDSYILIHNSNNYDVVPIDSIAVVIDCYEELTSENLEIAYGRIQKIKSIQKSDVQGPPEGDIAMTVCIVLCRSTVLPLEKISAKMSILNDTIPSHKWPDAVAALSSGIINYSAHIPTKDSSGDFFLPTEDSAVNSAAPPMFVKKVIRAGGDKTINKVMALIIARLAIYQPGAGLPNYNDFLTDFPRHGVTDQTYQFNLANVLIPMTREQAFAAQLPSDTFNIVSGKKKLASVQFQEWQDGGVFVIRGAFPIDLFLVFLREVVPSIKPSDLKYFRGSDTQVSYVLPIGVKEFFQTLGIFERRSNMRIEKETAKILMQKIEDEGTSSPYFARLMMDIMRTRDILFQDKVERDHFDRLYEPVLSNLRNARQTAKDISEMWEDHKKKVASGSIVKIHGRTVQISESIDRHIKRDIENFINLTVRTIKQSMQALINDLGVNIGFLFKKESAFHAGLSKLRATDPSLADYIYNVRIWSEPLILMRNEDLEHGAFLLQKIEYDLDSSPITAQEPEIGGKQITVLTAEILDHIYCFVEEVTTHCLQQKIPQGLNIAEVPVSERTPEEPERFIVTIEPGGRVPWVLLTHTLKFADV